MGNLLSVVVSVYNEEVVLKSFYKETKQVLDNIEWDYELLFVNDGSMDRSLEILSTLANEDTHVKFISFSRNFGHESAMIAGIDYSSGDAIICMDADLQHPPECIPKILEKFEQGFEIVNMVRTKNESAGWFKNLPHLHFIKLSMYFPM